MQTALFLDGFASLIAGGLYAYVGQTIAARRVSAEAALANGLFATWWFTLAVVSVLGAVFNAVALVVTPDVPFTLTVVNVMMILICLAVWSLICYLIYVFTGSRATFLPLAGAYSLLAFGLLYAIAWMDPIALDTATWPIEFTYARDLPGWAAVAMSLAISLPLMAATIGYGSLYFRLHGYAERYRVGLVSGAFLGWFGWSLLGTALGFNGGASTPLWWHVASKLVGIGVPLIIIAAYKPPRLIREKFGLPVVPSGS